MATKPIAMKYSVFVVAFLLMACSAPTTAEVAQSLDSELADVALADQIARDAEATVYAQEHQQMLAQRTLVAEIAGGTATAEAQQTQAANASQATEQSLAIAAAQATDDRAAELSATEAAAISATETKAAQQTATRSAELQATDIAAQNAMILSVTQTAIAQQQILADRQLQRSRWINGAIVISVILLVIVGTLILLWSAALLVPAIIANVRRRNVVVKDANGMPLLITDRSTPEQFQIINPLLPDPNNPQQVAQYLQTLPLLAYAQRANTSVPRLSQPQALPAFSAEVIEGDWEIVEADTIQPWIDDVEPLLLQEANDD